MFRPSMFAKKINLFPCFTKNKLTSALMTAMVVIIASGCSNNAADAGGSKIVNSAQAKTTVVANDSDKGVVSALQENLKASGIEEKIISAVPTDMSGVYWVTAEGLPPFFTDKSGKHIIQGQIISVGNGEPVDISSSLIAKTAQSELKNVAKKDMIIYPAKGTTKAVVYAFTDADCGYCRKLHEEISDINARGIEVRYLAWPRSEQSIPKMEAIWCSSDRQKAMNGAKIGEDVSAKACDNPVGAQMALGMRLGVRGTPAIFTESGQQIGGYLPAAQLAEAAINN